MAKHKQEDDVLLAIAQRENLRLRRVLDETHKLSVERGREFQRQKAEMDALIWRLQGESEANYFVARRDPLTGLANRLLFNERLGFAMDSASRHNDRRSREQHRLVALLYVDLDGFKEVNDDVGHHAGDAVLVAVGERIKKEARSTDTPARLGGDEFALIVPEVEKGNEGGVVYLAQRVLRSINEPIVMTGSRKVVVGVSVGISFCNGFCSPENFIRAADEQSRGAKSSGKNRIFVKPYPCG